MENKEKLEVVKKLQYCGVERYRLALEEVEKDLEVLEILKKRLNIKIPRGSLTVISANNDDDYLLFEVELQEHTKIEEWLNEK